MNIVFTEAVFANGKNTVKPIEECLKNVKARLEKEVKEKGDKFDPKAFFKRDEFKELENTIQKVFGFRLVSVYPVVEKYNSKTKKFESKQLNAFVYRADRFPIDGLVTEKGFYDKTHSLKMDVYFTNGIILALTPAELTAALLHEFGHGIDPALMTITYAETNALSKYLTDRKKEMTKNEKKALNLFKKNPSGTKFVSFLNDVVTTVSSIGVGDLFQTKKGVEKKNLKKIKELLKKDKEQFDKVNSAEAYADNFARMYGYGPALMNGLKKMNDAVDKDIESRYKKEKARANIIFLITKSMISDEHKTDVHRIHSLIKEYRKDINDPNTPELVKKQLQDDLRELENVLRQYTNNKGNFRNRVYVLIDEELTSAEKAATKELV